MYSVSFFICDTLSFSQQSKRSVLFTDLQELQQTLLHLLFQAAVCYILMNISLGSADVKRHHLRLRWSSLQDNFVIYYILLENKLIHNYVLMNYLLEAWHLQQEHDFHGNKVAERFLINFGQLTFVIVPWLHWVSVSGYHSSQAMPPNRLTLQVKKKVILHLHKCDFLDGPVWVPKHTCVQITW